MQLIIESSDEKVIQKIMEMIRPLNVHFQEVRTSTNLLPAANQQVNTKYPKKQVRKLGIMPGLVAYMSPDFNAPLEDFAAYM